MKNFYNLNFDKVIKELNSDKFKGLGYKSLTENIEKYGRNTIELGLNKKVEISVLSICKSSYMAFIILVLIFNLSLSQYLNSAILFIIILINLISKYIKIISDKKQIRDLELLNYTDVKVIRCGVKNILKAEELVVGDIIFIEKGNIVSADIRIIESDNLIINERNVTSVDFDVKKYSTRIEGKAESISDINNMAFRGTRVAEGYAKGVVVAIGNDTQLGKLLKYLKSIDKRRNSSNENFSKNIKKVNFAIALVGIIASIVLFFIKSMQSINIIADILFLIASTSLPAVIAIYRLLKKKEYRNKEIEINNINIIDNAKDIDIFFLDKIGSITEEEMIVQKIYTSEKMIEELSDIDLKDSNIARIIDIGILNNNSKFNSADNKYTGDLADGAMLKFATTKNIFRSALVSKYPKKFEVPYYGERRISTTLNKIKKQYRANVKGSLDEVLDKCKYIMIDGMERDLTDDDIEKIRMIDFNMSNNALITRGFAYRSFRYEPSEDENIESNLVFVGIVGFENPKKEGAKELIKKLKKEKVLPILITDDNKIIASRLGIELGISKGMEEVISGVELLSLNKDELITVLSRARILCKISPSIKSKIISMFKNDGYRIASTGENLSDMPTIVLSDVGITKGNKPANLIKKMSDVYIVDNFLEKFVLLVNESNLFEERLEKALLKCKWFMIIEIIAIVLAIIFLNNFELNSFAFCIFNFLTLTIIIFSYLFNFFEFIMKKW